MNRIFRVLRVYGVPNMAVYFVLIGIKCFG